MLVLAREAARVLVHEPEMMVVERSCDTLQRACRSGRYRLAYKRRVHRPLGAGKCGMTTSLIAAERI
jgi:hypothetical protein